MLAETSALRGSIYHHLPRGKEELVTRAIGATQAHALHLIDQDMATLLLAATEGAVVICRAEHQWGNSKSWPRS